ncbi:MAG: flagellar motor switch protein FliM [Geminicoccaceae bacterium]
MSETHGASPGRAIERMVRRQAATQQRFALLEAVFETFTLQLWTSLRRLAGDEAQVVYKSSEVVRFCEVRDGIQPGALLAVFHFKEWHGHALILLDAPMVDAAIEALLGGGQVGNSSPAPRAYTVADRAVVGRLARATIDALARAFLETDPSLGPLTGQLVRFETSSGLAVVERNDGLTTLARFEATIAKGHGGRFDLVLPHSMMEPVRRASQRTHRGGRRPGAAASPGELLPLLPNTAVTLHAVVDRVRVSAYEIAGWQVGSLVTLDADAGQPVAVYCEREGNRSIGQKVFMGRLGSSRGRRAIRISGAIDNNPTERPDQETVPCPSSSP